MDKLELRMAEIGYSSYEIKPGSEEVDFLYVQGYFVCGVLYAMTVSAQQLKELIDETLLYWSRAGATSQSMKQAEETEQKIKKKTKKL